MNTLIILAFIAALLLYITKIPLGIAMKRTGKYDNHNPREQQAKLTGFGARALAAHQNAFESFIVFGAAIAIALATKSVDSLMINIAITHVVARVVYSIMYYIDQDILRTLSWLVATVCSFSIIWLSMS